MRPARGIAALVAAGLLAACSTLAPKPPEVECTGNDDANDCPDGFVCELGVCRDASDRPPLNYIGLDLQEVAGGQAQFRVELAGCDNEVLRTGDAIKVLSLPRPEVARTMFLGVREQQADPDVEPVALPSTFELTQGSRFNRDGLRRQVSYPLDGDVLQTLLPVPWPRYFVDNDLPGFLGREGFLVWLTEPLPGEDTPAPASRYQLLSPPVSVEGESCTTDTDCCLDADCDPEDVRNACIPSLGECRIPFDDEVTYQYAYADACDRELKGRVIRVDDALTELSAIPGATVTIRHADPGTGDRLGLPRLDPQPIEERPTECAQDSQCLPELVCNADTGQCELPLAGLSAWSGPVPTEAAPGTEGSFTARTFTYCEGLPTSEPLERTFDVVVSPPEESGLPSVNLRADITFDPVQAGQQPPADFPANLCVPDWGPPQDITLSITGEPRPLLPGYTCCDVDCLPRTEEDAQTPPPEARSACDGSGSGSAPTYRVETPLSLSDKALQAWTDPDSDCLGFSSDANGAIGTLRRSAPCESGDDDEEDDDDELSSPGCVLSLPAATDDTERTYALRIETPTGAVGGSVDTTLSLTADAGASLLDVELPPRTLLQGRVLLSSASCDADTEDCGSPGAKVLAERLRMMGETVANTPGPYFHEVATFHDPTAADAQRDGAYILPLDPGVWVLTALPDSGTLGGPARLLIVDLRQGPDEARQDFVLDEGILVTLDVRSFDRRSQVVPLDIGSWSLPGDSQLIHPDRALLPAPDNLVDLGAVGECLARDSDASAATGCRIRRLIGGSSLPPTQVGQVRFTARDLESFAAVDCQ